MPRPPLARLAATLRLARRPADVPDADHALLARFVQSRDEAAFRSLVNRHAGTVLTACRQVLADPADVDDAFQATFLVLLQKAKGVDASTPLDGWLFAVAHRVAVRYRADKARRSAREAEAARRTRTTTEPPDLSWKDAVGVLHAELNALPDQYRLPLILCYLQGLARDDAAEQLGTTVGAVGGRLVRGRALLERRLAKRGVVLSAGLLAVLMGSSRSAGGPPVALIELAVRAAGGNASRAVAALTTGAFPMTTTLKRVLLPAVLAVGLLGAGVGFTPRLPVANADDKKPTPDSREKPKADAKGERKTEEDKPKERSITGTVIAPDGKAVQADLHLIWIDGKPESLGKTKADGTFTVTVPVREPGAWLVAKADGFGIDFMMPATNTPAEVTFKLVKDVPVRGRLIDPEGNPVAGASVHLRTVGVFEGDTAQPFLDAWKQRSNFRDYPAAERQSLYNTSRLPFATTTDKDGRFELTGAGAERLVSVQVRGAGRAETEVHVITREKFDPKPFNDATLALRPTNGSEKLSWGFNPMLYAPEFTLAVEPEKPIRGTLTDAESGKPRAGVEVALDQDDGTSRHVLRAATDAEGRYELRGAKKWATYDLTVRTDARDGFLAVRVRAKDTVGYEPVVADVACPKGVVVRGTARDKATGRPLTGRVQVNVMAGNQAARSDPALKGYTGHDYIPVAADGAYRAVVIPGPVLLSFGTGKSGLKGDYKLAKADPRYPHLFEEAEGGVRYRTPGGGVGIVDGNWCRVIDAKDTDTELVQDIDLEPATRKAVRVADADGKPVTGGHATGTNSHQWHYAEPLGDADTLTVLNLEPKEERLVAVAHAKRRLVGTAVVREGDKDPVVTLGGGGTVTGRAVDADGKPFAGVTVNLFFARREVTEAAEALNAGFAPRTRLGRREVTTDANGEFRIDAVFPGYEFRLTCQSGKKALGPAYPEATKHTLGKHGDELKLGDLKLEPAKEE